MSITSSFNAGVAGLSVNATRLATISDNIANSSTYGYKRVETDFQSIVIGESGGGYSAGGVSAQTQRLIDENGTVIGTKNATDLAIRGDGFFPVARTVQVESGIANPTMLLTSTGSFRPDANGYLNTESGLTLMGWAANPDGTIHVQPRDTSTGLEPVRINTTQLTGEPTTEVGLGVNLPATETYAGASGDPFDVSVEYYDNLGISETLDITFTPTVPATGRSNEWTMSISDSATPAASNPIGVYTVTFDDSAGTGGSILTVTQPAPVTGNAYNTTTGTLTVTTSSGPLEIDLGTPGSSSRLTQLSDSFAPLNITKDGTPVGTMTSVEVDERGFVNALFDTGVTRTIYQVPLASMPNPNGLMAMSAQTYMTTLDSGAYYLWDAGTGPTGEVVGFAREGSTAEVAGELTNMIQTQRAYSSNAKVIQTVDEMLQETTNIKR